MTRALALVWSVSLGACHYQPQVVEPRAIEGSRERIVAGKQIQLESIESERMELEPDHVVELVTMDGKRLPMRLDELVRDCPEHGAAPHQLCKQSNVAAVIIGSKLEMNNTAAVALRSAIGVGLLVGLPVCAFECRSPYNYVADGFLLVAAVTVVVAIIATR